MTFKNMTFTTLWNSPLDILFVLKWLLSYVFIRIYNAFNSHWRFDLYDVLATGEPVKLGFLVPQLEKELESPLPESKLKESLDEILFYGVNSERECLLVGIRRHINQKTSAWLHLQLRDGRSYCLPNDCSGYQSPDNRLRFSSGDLDMYYLTPMRTWRITYCGMLKAKSQDETDAKWVFVKFIFLWKASSDVYDLTLHSNAAGIAAAIARSSWKFPFLPPINEFVECSNFYAQSGVIDGTVSVNDTEDHVMYLYGEKMRNLGKRSYPKQCKFTKILGSTLQNGYTFHIAQATRPYLFQNLPFGFIIQPSGKVEVIKESEIKLLSQSNLCIKAKGLADHSFEIKGNSNWKEPITLYYDETRKGYIEFCYAEFEMGKTKGIGLIMKGEIYEEPAFDSKPIITENFTEDLPLTVQFSHEVCSFSDVSGGKGSSLGKLTYLSGKNEKFIVPKGVVVTTAGYEEFLTSDIYDAVEVLENIVYGKEKGDLKNACSLTSTAVEMTPMPRKICYSIIKNLTEMFGEDVRSRKFAVRSSSTGEDTSVMSAAGQMDTYLGICGFEEIITAVKKCWASQFGFVAVEYKRQNGQILNSPMAVVIQEMVSCEVSGVLFTCDPVSNNPSILTITSNYGLGESVVSGLVEPDTITLKREEDGLLNVKSVLLGAKHQRIVLEESGGTTLETVNEDLKSKCCLSEEMSIRLGSLAIEIERFYRSPRDIEWGILDENIYIFQSRPITNVARETDYELMHEFDAPLRIENDFVTIANIGEVMPGATSPLGREMFMKMFSTIMKKRAQATGQLDNVMQSKYFSSGLFSFYNHMMMGVVELISRFGTDTPTAKGFMISIFGRVLDDPELLACAKERAGPPTPQSMMKNILYFWDMITHTSKTAKVKEKSDAYEMKYLKAKTSDEAFTALMNSCSDFEESVMGLMVNTENSSQWNVLLFQILCDAKGGKVDTEIYSDFARLIATSSNVESADVPRALKELALHIQANVSAEEFKSMTVEEAEKWLKTSSSSKEKFKYFLKRHGHRCLKESDVRSVTWSMNPTNLVQLLQNMVGNCSDEKIFDEDYESLFSQLSVQLSFWARLKLKLILPYCHRGVRGREAAKTLIVKSFDYLRQGFLHISKLMVSEGRLPDADLVFFLSLFEIQELIGTRSPNLISRAKYRKKIFPILENFKFPEMMRGIPKPINETSDLPEFESSENLRMEGIPVSQGIARGFARVAVSLEEATLLKPGEILITHSTDIGWAPYFPIVSGVATELGGLISHGAVVSREYGLPCVVGLQGATRKFKTGDYVLLDGKKGILQRCPELLN